MMITATGIWRYGKILSALPELIAAAKGHGLFSRGTQKNFIAPKFFRSALTMADIIWQLMAKVRDAPSKTTHALLTAAAI